MVSAVLRKLSARAKSSQQRLRVLGPERGEDEVLEGLGHGQRLEVVEGVAAAVRVAETVLVA